MELNAKYSSKKIKPSEVGTISTHHHQHNAGITDH